MKLISLYIDNFGKLSDYSFDFSKTLNSLYEENGWGKTTLTVFIKSMLYARIMPGLIMIFFYIGLIISS